MAEREKRYRFNDGVTIDARGNVPACRYEAGDEISASEFPPYADLTGLLQIGALVEVDQEVLEADNSSNTKERT